MDSSERAGISAASGEVTAGGVFGGRKTLSVMLTYACPAQCHSCGTGSSPHDPHVLNLDVVLEGMREASALGFRNVVFTGGEATLRWDDLLTALRLTRALGLPSRLVTNAHWATDMQAAGAAMDALLDAGLNEINFSTGDEHTRFIPLENVVRAAVTTVRRGLTAFVMVEMRAERRISSADLLNHPMVLELPDEQRARVKPTESPWMPLNPFKVETYPDGIAINEDNLASCAGCDSVLQTYVMQADGRVGACCGLGMRLIPELSVGRCSGPGQLEHAIQEAEEDFLKLWVHYQGPEHVLAWAARHDPSVKWENMYGHRCQACLRLYKDPRVRQLVRDHHEEMIGVVLQTAWLRERFIPHRLDPAAKGTTASS